MPVVPAEKLIQLQQNAENVRNICIMAHVVSGVHRAFHRVLLMQAGPWQNLPHRRAYRHQRHYIAQARWQDKVSRLAARRAIAGHHHGVLGHLAVLLAATTVCARCTA
jgi:hypothetical protein